MPRLKLLEMDIDNKMIYFRKDDKIIAYDADGAIELISDSLDGKYAPVRHGHWQQLWEDKDQIQARCSCCGVVFWIGKGRDGNYCPNCGAKMDEVREDD